MSRTSAPKPECPLIDALIKENRLRNDSHLADEIGYSKGRICDFRSGKVKISAEFRLAIQRKYGWSIKRIDTLAPPEGEKK